MQGLIRKTLIHGLVPIERAIGPVHWPVKQRFVTEGDIDRVLAVAKPADAFVTRTRGCLINLPIPGFWSHAALYLGEGLVLEATGCGVHTTSLKTFMLGKTPVAGEEIALGKDFMRVLTPNFEISETQRREIACLGLKQCGLPYDYGFEFATNAFYCAEVVWWTYLRIMNFEPFETQNTLKISYATPDDLAVSSKWNCPLQVGGTVK